MLLNIDSDQMKQVSHKQIFNSEQKKINIRKKKRIVTEYKYSVTPEDKQRVIKLEGLIISLKLTSFLSLLQKH